MKFSVLKEIFQEKLSLACRFYLSKTSSSTTLFLYGGKLEIKEKKLKIVTTNLNDFFCATIEIESNKEKEAIVDIKKIVEFLSFLPPGKIEVEISDKELIVRSNKTEGVFNLSPAADFPSFPKTEGKKIYFNKKILKEKLPLILFAASKDESRPILTGVNFSSKDDKQYMVATDGFRLSLFFEKKEEEIPPIIISSFLLKEINKMLKDDKEDVEMFFSSENKTIQIELKNNQISVASQIIDGEFPPFEKVLPKEWRTRIILEKEEFLRNMRLVSVFARDYSNIVFFEIKKDGLYLYPKTKEGGRANVYQEGKMEGESQKIAFNYKFILDFLTNVGGEKVVFEMTHPNAPATFKTDLYDNFLHIIMPIRTEDEG